MTLSDKLKQLEYRICPPPLQLVEYAIIGLATFSVCLLYVCLGG